MKRRSFRAHPRHPLTGKQFTVSARTHRELEVLLAHLDLLRGRHRLGLISDGDVSREIFRIRRGKASTLEQAVRLYLARPTLATSTRRGMESCLAVHLHELGPLALEELTAPRLATWVESLGRKLTAGSIAIQWRRIRAVIRYALERGIIDRCPWGSWRPTIRGRVRERPPREAARHAGELRELLDGALRSGGLLLQAKIACASLLGLRQGELAGLRWSDVDPNDSYVRIARGAGGPTKGRRVDVVCAVPELFAILRAHANALRAADLYRAEGPIFPCPWRSAPGEPRPYLERAEVLTTRELRRAVQCAELPHPERWSPHSLRDTFVTLEVEGAGGDLEAARERSRHASIASLVRYVRARTREPAPPRMRLNGASSPPLLGPGRTQ